MSNLPLNQIICGDCLDELAKLPEKSVDLILTDPPFFVPATHYQSRIKWQKSFGDLTPLKAFWKTVNDELARVLKPTGHIMVFCNAESYPVFFIPTYEKFDKVKTLVWDKTRVGLGHIFRNQHELIMWARWQEHKVIEDGKLRADVISFPATLTKDREHPVEKPTELLEHLISATTNKGDIVLDPFAGGGSTLLAASNLKRHYIGVEINQTYADVVKARLGGSINSFLA